MPNEEKSIATYYLNLILFLLVFQKMTFVGLTWWFEGFDREMKEK
jgi:hypothetical protein